MGSITCIILTKNEEKIFPAPFKMLRPGPMRFLSLTLEVTMGPWKSQKSGASVIYRAWDGDFAAQRNFALTGAHGDWVLYLDADERLTAGAIQKVLAIKKGAPNHHYSFRRENIAFGHHFHHGAFGPDRVVRLFPKAAVHWEGKVHEHAVCTVPLEALSERMDHYTYAAFADWWRKAGQYTTIWADDAYARGKGQAMEKQPAMPFWACLRSIFSKEDFLKEVWASLPHSSTVSIRP